MINVKSDLKVSFEFFPPKNEEMEESLWKNLKRLEPLKPEFVSVTYGAGGSTRDRTHKLVKKIKNETSLEPAAHLTCMGSTPNEIKKIAENYWDDGIKHIVALRGDIPKDKSSQAKDLSFATDLIKALKKNNDFEITVSAYPEGHPDSKTREQDFDVLKKKIDLSLIHI